MMIILSFLCLKTANRLRKLDTENVIWSYLEWVCFGLVIFAVSRSAGHIVKQLLILNGQVGIWHAIRPYSGSINTFAFILVGSITIFFRQTWKIYLQISKDKSALQQAHSELVSLNQNLEERVEQRTRALAIEAEQRMQLEKHMAQTEKLAAIGELSAGIAHEINNPLGIILGFNQLLIRAEKPDSPRLKDLKKIEKNVKHCKSIISDLLNFSRSSKTKKELVNILMVIDEAIDLMKNTDFSTIELQKNYQENLPLVFIDTEKIKQVFINLLMNAKYAMGKKGLISITGAVDQYNGCDHIFITIGDTGCGIGKNIINRIFDPFFTTKPTGEGTGLGLSVSYGIIQNHGGDILVETEEQKGTKFTIVLPIPDHQNKEN
jgi:signal transduction histidine kinase